MTGFRMGAVLEIAALGLAGLILGWVFSTTGLPMPYLMGTLLVTSLHSVVHANRRGRSIAFPPSVRKWAMAVIGVMIGASFTPDILPLLPSLWPSVSAMIVYVILMQISGYLFFRHLGNYDHPTAYFSAMPGGLVEAISLGEEAGADTRILIVQHFSRVVIIVLAVPLAFFLFSGEPVGSGAGETYGSQGFSLMMALQWITLVVSGILVARFAHLPAGHMMGPLVLSCIVHAGGWVSLTSPGWLFNSAQLIIGLGLGVMFTGLPGKVLARIVGMGVVTVTVALLTACLFAVLLSRFVDLSFGTLLICFAPGGAVEMGLIALSLGINPLIVVLHHLLRILFTVGINGIVSRWFHNTL